MDASWTCDKKRPRAGLPRGRQTPLRPHTSIPQEIGQPRRPRRLLYKASSLYFKLKQFSRMVSIYKMDKAQALYSSSFKKINREKKLPNYIFEFAKQDPRTPSMETQERRPRGGRGASPRFVQGAPGEEPSFVKRGWGGDGPQDDRRRRHPPQEVALARCVL